MPQREDLELVRRAIALDAEAHALLLEGRGGEAAGPLGRAREAYLASWRVAPPGSYGRLVGAVKDAILLDGDVMGATAEEVRTELGDAASPTAAYALALAALAQGDDATAAAAARRMAEGGEAFERAAAAIAALAAGDAGAYREAIAAIVDDFAGRDAHLTGVAIADTAAVLERLAAARGLAAELDSPLLPPLHG